LSLLPFKVFVVAGLPRMTILNPGYPWSHLDNNGTEFVSLGYLAGFRFLLTDSAIQAIVGYRKDVKATACFVVLALIFRYASLPALGR